MKKAIAFLACVAVILMSLGLCSHLLHFPAGHLEFLLGAAFGIVADVLLLTHLLGQPGLKCTKTFVLLSVLFAIVAACFGLCHWPYCSLLVLVALGLLIPISAILLSSAYARSK